MAIKINRQNLSEHLLEYQFEMIGKTVQEAIADKEWLQKWSLTQQQHDGFKVYSVKLIKKIFKCRKERAEKTFDWFNLQFGLPVKN